MKFERCACARGIAPVPSQLVLRLTLSRRSMTARVIRRPHASARERTPIAGTLPPRAPRGNEVGYISRQSAKGENPDRSPAARKQHDSNVVEGWEATSESGAASSCVFPSSFYFSLRLSLYLSSFLPPTPGAYALRACHAGLTSAASREKYTPWTRIKRK